MTGKRHAPQGPRRCKHRTSRGSFCWQHLKEKEGLRIMKVPNAKLGLVATKPFEKNDKVTEIPTANFAQPSIRPNAKIRKRTLKATKDIAKNTEITVPVSGKSQQLPVVAPLPKKKKYRLIKPDHGPDMEDLPPVIEEEEDAPKQPTRRGIFDAKPRKKRIPYTPQEKHEIFHLKRLIALENLWNDEKLAHKLKIPTSKRRFKVPSKKKGALFNYELEKMLKKETGDWVNYVNKANPRTRMTYDKAFDIIEKIVKERK